MKTQIVLLMFICVSFIGVEAQIKINPKKKVENAADRRANKKTDQAVDKAFDGLEEGIGSLFKKKKKKKGNADEAAAGESETQSTNGAENGDSGNDDNGNTGGGKKGQKATEGKPAKPQVQWARFDFVPGDEVIFEDAPDMMEENGEFPSRWDLVEGNCEIVNVNGQNVISFPQGGTIIPYLKNSKEDYLPDVFTVEFDAYFRPGYARRVWVELYDHKNQRSGNNNNITCYINSVHLDNTSGTYPGRRGNKSETGGWRHFSVAFTKGKLKVYIDDTRLINIPRYEHNPTGISIRMDGYSSDKPEDLQYIKNIRIAKGGVKYYDRVMSEGKIICNGIRFDIGKATLKPESMGAINKIYELMQKQPDLKFSVEGHTDSDGNDATNQTLSEARAKTVMEQLVSMGISKDRLTSKGFGESQPIAGNDTPEGKANNRRVEFVKF